MKCPNCGNELDEDKYCDECFEFFNDLDDDSQDFGFEEEPDFDSMVNNGDEICLNCTYWSVSPYGRAHGMYCRPIMVMKVSFSLMKHQGTFQTS